MRKKKSGVTKIVVITLVIILLLAAVGILFMQWSKEKEQRIAFQTELNTNTQTVYVATSFIEAGTALVADGETPNVAKQQIRTGLEVFNYITEEELGSVALVDVPEGMPILYNMVSTEEIENDTREYELSVVNLATDQAENDFVDVRIMFPNGEDYIILSQKRIQNLGLEACVFTTTLNEEEILRMDSAIVDAYTTTGAYIYTTRYVAAGAQEKATPNYPVRGEIIDLINSDPNVLTKAIDTLNLSARMNLEARLGNLSQEELSAVSEGLGLNDTAKGSVLSQSHNTTETADTQTGTADVEGTSNKYGLATTQKQED